MIRNQYEREHDPNPVTEEFARSVAVMVHKPYSTIYDIDAHMTMSIIVLKGEIRLAAKGMIVVDHPTIGQFWTACRLFGVTVKQQPDAAKSPAENLARELTDHFIQTGQMG